MKKTICECLLWALAAFVVLGFLFLPAGLAMAGAPSGKDLYQAKCAMCHGVDGVAKPMWTKAGARNFNDPAWQKSVTDELMVKSINEGIPAKKMPAYSGKLEPAQIKAVVEHIRTLAPSK